MASLADIWVAVHPDTSSTGRELDRKLSNLDVSKGAGTAGTKAGHRFGSALLGVVKTTAVGIGAALAGGGVIAGRYLAGAVQSASNLNETMSKVGVIFGKSGKDLNKWAANAATDLGQTKQEALDAAATFGVFGKAAGKSGSGLANFSIHLTGLAADMASFSNTTPQDAIEALTAALRGEFDPIERYGVLLNQATLQQVALDKGIVKATGNQAKITAARVAARVALHNYNAAVREHGKGSLEAAKASAALGLAQDRLATATKGTVAQLTPQQRILAVQAALYEQLGKKGSGAMGDFERTSAGLANQQRILTAQLANVKTEIGAGLLPVTTRFVTQLNTQVIPALLALWREHGPKVTAFLTKAGDAFTGLVTRLARGDFAGQLASLRVSFSGFAQQVGPAAQSVRQDLVPALAQLRAEGGQSLADTMRVTGVAMKFLAEHTDLLAKALPVLAAGFVIAKTAQVGANVAMTLSPVLRIAEVVATRQQTKAIVANTAAVAVNRTATVGATVAVAAETTATNVGFLARARATVGMVAQRVATIAATAATWLATAATTALGVAVRFATGPIGIIITVIAALAAAVIYAYKHNETFRKIVQAVWAAVKVAIKAVGDWFVNTLWPSIRTAIDQAKTAWNVLRTVTVNAWNGLKNGLNTGWTFIRDKVFNPVKTFITSTIPAAFQSGVAAIGRVWAGLQELAKRPVRFVVDTVINGAIIGTFNKVSGFFGGPKISPVSLPRGFGDGPGPAGASPAPKAKRQTGDGFGDILGFLRGPVNWVKSRIAGKLGDITGRFGDNPFAQMLKGMGGKLLSGLIDKAKSLFATSDLGAGSGSIAGLQPAISAVLASLRRVFGAVRLISGFRPGARTLSGNLSYHALGRAIDIPPVYAWASFLNAAYGRQLKELITPWQNFNILNGRRHTYTGAVWNQHNFAGGNAHIHAAMAGGGIINEPIFGIGRSGRTYSLGERGPETVVPGVGRGGDVHVHLHNAVITSERAAVDLVVKAVKTAQKERRL